MVESSPRRGRRGAARTLYHSWDAETSSARGCQGEQREYRLRGLEGNLILRERKPAKEAGHALFPVATLNPETGELAAPDSVRAAAEPTPVAEVTAEEVAAGIWYLTGQSHHSVLVEFADHLTLIEAPQHEARTLAVIGKARELRPEKPLRQVINTHHHFDHSAGIRAAVSEGLAVITHDFNGPFFEAMVARPHTVVLDALARNPKPLAVETVGEKKVLSDGKRSLEIYPVSDSPHCGSMLMVYFPAERILAQVDAFSPPAPNAPTPPAFPFAANLLENVEKRGLRVERLLPLHGRSVPFRDLVAVVRAAPRPTE
jgi:glyoxylase-like metal-dependent hydrolase (beta-lactamase superfamily II)